MIVKASKKDEKALKGISKLAIYETVDVDPDLKEEIIEDTFKHIKDGVNSSNRVFLVFKDQEECLGYIQIKEYWNLSDLFVLPKSHGKKIGKELLVAALKMCRIKSDKDYVRTNSSLNAEGFYRKAGFSSYTPEKPVPSFVFPLIFNLSNTI